MHKSMVGFSWECLPHEMKLAILDHLPLKDIWSCAQSSRDSYATCLPILFHTVSLPTLEALHGFLEAVPAHHCQLIRDLRISTQSTSHDIDQYDAFSRPSAPSPDGNTPLAELLRRCSGLEALEIKVCGGLDANMMIPIFHGAGMERVKKLRVENLEMEEVAPISERLIVTLAFSLPSLESVSLTRITRSALHAQELLFSSVPLAQDIASEITAHPVLGTELRLPQLLRLPRLKQLRIRDTHLGDPMWEEVTSECPLEVLDLGSCAYVSPAANELHTARILARAPPSITACALSTSLPPPSQGNSAISPVSPTCKPSGPFSASYSPSSPISPASPNYFQELAQQMCIPPLPRLRTLHLTPLVPTSSISTTLSQPGLAGSPVQTLSCTFHPDDAAEGLRELEGFLKERDARERAVKASQITGLANGRKRASSRLGMCSQHEVIEEDVPTPRTRANTTGTSPTLQTISLPPVSPISAASRLYPSLATLTIDIPSAQDQQSLMSPSGAKLSPRRLAAARRRAEERREAAVSLRQIARGSGMRVVFRGFELDSDEDDECKTVTAFEGIAKAEKGAVRARANSA